MKIKELPINERPREKAIRYGIDKLSNEELLAILIRTGSGKQSALDIAHTLNGQSGGLNNLFHRSYESIVNTYGIGPSKALILTTCFELCKRYSNISYGESGKIDGEKLYLRYLEKLNDKNNENFVLVILNRKKEIIYEETLFIGSEHLVSCPLDEVIKKVIIHNGKNFYIIHNHPSGDSSPSSSDIYVTDELMRLSKKLGIKLEDHLIISENEYYSFKDNKVYANSR